jgi:hypothetical protein
MTRRGWVSGGGPVLVGVAAIPLLLAGCSGGASDGSSSVPSSTASAVPAISAAPAPAAAPTPSAAPSGFLPVDSLGAKSIPWDQVGPGWFLVDWAQHDVVWDDNTNLPVSPADASVSLLSPDGTWYTAASLKATGSHWTEGWLGDTVAVIRETQPTQENGYGDVSYLNLKTGASRQVLSGTRSEMLSFAADGTLVSQVLDETFSVAWYDGQMARHSVFDEGAQPASVAPDGKSVVTLVYASVPSGSTDDQTELVVGPVGSPGEAQVIDTLRLPPYSYTIRGWIDPDTFLVGRAPQPGETQRTTYYTYNIVTRKVADFSLPFSAPFNPGMSTGDVSFDWASQTYAEESDSGVNFFRVDGTPFARLGCPGSTPVSAFTRGWGINSRWDPKISGARALVACEDSASEPGLTVTTFTLVNLKDGTVTNVGSVKGGPGQGVRAIYPYTGNVD